MQVRRCRPGRAMTACGSPTFPRMSFHCFCWFGESTSRQKTKRKRVSNRQGPKGCESSSLCGSESSKLSVPWPSLGVEPRVDENGETKAHVVRVIGDQRTAAGRPSRHLSKRKARLNAAPYMLFESSKCTQLVESGAGRFLQFQIPEICCLQRYCLLVPAHASRAYMLVLPCCRAAT